MTKFFGQRWDAPMADHATQVPTPVGELCLECHERIEEGDRGVMVTLVHLDSDQKWVPTLLPAHLECNLRATMSHYFGQCRCFVPARSLREEARATLAAINEQRAEQGRGPL